MVVTLKDTIKPLQLFIFANVIGDEEMEKIKNEKTKFCKNFENAFSYSTTLLTTSRVYAIIDHVKQRSLQSDLKKLWDHSFNAYAKFPETNITHMGAYEKVRHVLNE